MVQRITYRRRCVPSPRDAARPVRSRCAQREQTGQKSPTAFVAARWRAERAGARRERPAGAPTRHARRRRASEGYGVKRPHARILAASAGVVSGASRARRCAASSFRVFWPRLGRVSLSPLVPRRADLRPCVFSRLFVSAGTRTRPGRTRCASCASPAAL